MTFADFYQTFPRKKARGDAEKAWSQALKKGYSPEEIMAGLQRNLQDLCRRDPQFCPYPASWLRAESFFDEPDPISQRNPGRRTIADAAASFDSLFSDFNAPIGLPDFRHH